MSSTDFIEGDLVVSRHKPAAVATVKRIHVLHRGEPDERTYCDVEYILNGETRTQELIPADRLIRWQTELF